MPNYYLSVLYKHIIQVENKNVGLKVWGGGGGTNIPLPAPIKNVPPPLAPPASYASDIYILLRQRYLSLISILYSCTRLVMT